MQHRFRVERPVSDQCLTGTANIVRPSAGFMAPADREIEPCTSLGLLGPEMLFRFEPSKLLHSTVAG